MRKQIADISLDESYRLKGFRILAVFPLSVSYIKVSTHIELCKIREQIKEVCGNGELADFYNPQIQAKSLPLVAYYCATAICNRRWYLLPLKGMIKRKIQNNSHAGILNLMMTIQKLDEPAFFLTYCKLLTQPDGTLLREGEQSSEEYSPTKKKQENPTGE